MQRNIARSLSLVLPTLALALVASTGVALAQPDADTVALEDQTTIVARTPDQTIDHGSTSLDASEPFEAGTCTMDCYAEYKACVKDDGCGCQADLDLCLSYC
ncbi:MAG: hypothetical protein KC431_19215 [Myxococcales bacterium]|nr:hypothetical protein [Myxococcales bacterium]